MAKAGARAGLEWPASYTFLNDDPATRNRFLPSSPPPPLVVHLLRRCHDFLGAAIVLARGFTGDPPHEILTAIIQSSAMSFPVVSVTREPVTTVKPSTSGSCCVRTE